MPVVVRLPGAQGRMAERRFDDGDDIGVDDVGCLAVTAGEGKQERTVAVFAPGVWVSAEVV